MTLAIGDGYNDKLMLQNADVGIKIVKDDDHDNKSYDIPSDIYLTEFH